MNTTPTAPVGEVSVRVVWARPQETPEEIARQVDLFMQGMRERTGISLWTLGTERTPWPKDQAEQAELVSQMKSTEGLARQGDGDGYAFWVRGFTSEAMAVAHVSAGQDHTGGRIPAQRADIEVTAVDGEHIPRAFTDAVVSSAVEGWDPLMVRLGTIEMQRLARRGNWKITPGYRLWLADAVGRIDHIADGVQAERVETGTLLTLPDDWSAQQVVDATQKTLELNGLDELPSLTVRSIWKSIPVDEALDMLQFWVDANWPMTDREAAELSSEIGWTQDQDGWVSNDLFGLSFPDIEGIGPADDPVKRILLTLTDHEKHITDDFARFIAGRFPEYVDGAEKLWGKGALCRGEVDRAYFDLESRGGVMIVRSKVVEALYLTQPEVDLRKANKEWAT